MNLHDDDQADRTVPAGRVAFQWFWLPQPLRGRPVRLGLGRVNDVRIARRRWNERGLRSRNPGGSLAVDCGVGAAAGVAPIETGSSVERVIAGTAADNVVARPL